MTYLQDNANRIIIILLTVRIFGDICHGLCSFVMTEFFNYVYADIGLVGIDLFFDGMFPFKQTICR